MAFGERVMERASRDALLNLDLITDGDSFIPHGVLWRFADSIARQTGHDDFGLLIAPHLSIENYGCWGEYVLGAETLRGAAERGMQSIRFHSIGDRFVFSIDGDLARIGYLSAAKGKPGYSHVACGTLGVLLSICRCFLPLQWRPLRVELDFPRPALAWQYEDTFGCPVVFDAESPAVFLETRHLSARRPRAVEGSPLTLGDLARSRSAISAANLPTIVAEQVRLQLLGGAVSLEPAAQALDMSIRTLRRRLDQDGTSFRDITTAVRLTRARSLLAETRLSVTQIAIDLGYSAPAHFARAFRKVEGRAPGEYRRSSAP